MQIERDFKGIWIPKEIWLIDEINVLEKVLLIEIDSLDNDFGCIASNEYFANFLGISETRVSQMISNLKKLDYIYEESFDGRRRILKSAIKIIVKQNKENYEADLKKTKGRLEKNYEHNNISSNQSNNLFSNNKKYKKETILSEKEILFEQFYKLYNSLDEIKESTKTTKGYNKLKEKFLKETKTAKEEDVLQGTKDYLSFIAFEHKRGFNRPLKDIQTFINQNAWDGDKGIPWNEIMQKNLENEKNTFINKITAPNAYEIKKQLKEQERWTLPDDDMPF